RPVWSRREAAFLEQRRLDPLLALGPIAIEVLGQEPVARRIPRDVVDAVEDSAQVGTAARQHALEAEAELAAALDLARIARADGREQVGEREADLHVVDA